VISASAYTKSSYCGVGSCVEVRLLADGRIGVRDSKDVSRPDLVFTQPEWRAFLAGVHDGEFDLMPA
jgi:Domain of unknown function (DUF397)